MNPHPHGGWQSKIQISGSGEVQIDELPAWILLLLGKTTYENFAAYCLARPARSPIPSTRCQNMSYPEAAKGGVDNSHILREVAGDVAALEKSDGGDILVYGSAHPRQGPAFTRPHR